MLVTLDTHLLVFTLQTKLKLVHIHDCMTSIKIGRDYGIYMYSVHVHKYLSADVCHLHRRPSLQQ